MKLCLLHPKDVEHLGWKSFEKPHGLLSPGVGFPPPTSFFRVAPPMNESTPPPQSGVAGTWTCLGDGVRKEEGMGHKL